MRITFLTPEDNLNGGTRVVAIYAQQLRARGHEVLVVSNAPAPVTLRQRWRALRHGHWQAQQREIRASRAPGHLAMSGVPHRALERHRPIVAADLPDADIVVATWWETAVWMHAMPASKGRKVHLIQGYEAFWWMGDALRNQVYAALRLPNLKIAISVGLKRDLEATLGDLGMAVVPNAVDQRQFDAPARERNSPPTVGFMYATDPIKGADRSLRIIERAREHLPDLQVLAFGTVPPTAEVPLPAGTEFHLQPAQRDLAGLYARCDAWLFPSRVDSFGLPIVEAMACRTPVIGLPIGAAPDMLIDGAGVLVEPADESTLPEAMAQALVSLIRSPAEHWQQMSERAHARAHAYSWEDAAVRLEALLTTPAGQDTRSVAPPDDAGGVFPKGQPAWPA